ncbi:MAG: ATP-binding protein [Anaerolineae bacterium]|jgi:two-component system phosphate regulon sensor histidine kinase PhoR|nr:ATP-binding protein [Anaerolineae bacterium]
MLEFLVMLLAIALIVLGRAYWQLSNKLTQAPLPTFVKSASTGEIERLEQTLQAKNEELNQLRTELDRLRIEVAHQQESLTANEVRLSELHQSLTLKASELTPLQQSVEQAHQTIHSLQSVLEAKTSETAYKLALTLTLANGAFDALLVIDRETNVLAMNTAAEKLFNTQYPVLNRRLLDMTHIPSLELMVEDTLINEEELLEEQIMVGERTYRVRVQIMRRDDHEFIGVAMQDVSQLVKLNRARRDMVANISHELRTPIANIRLIIDGLFHEQDKPKRKDSISSLRAIARETDSLLWLVQEMADLSMIESGQAIVRMIEVSLSEIVHDATERLADQYAAKHLRVARHIPEKMRVLCDRDLIQRVVMNLLHNAMKWSPIGNVVTISAANAGDEVIISVYDNGPGVPEDQVERIFERFYQVDMSRSGQDGSGLGLAICRHIVEAHGGRIWAEGNTDGSGGRFRFTLLSVEPTLEINGYSEQNGQGGS